MSDLGVQCDRPAATGSCSLKPTCSSTARSALVARVGRVVDRQPGGRAAPAVAPCPLGAIGVWLGDQREDVPLLKGFQPNPCCSTPATRSDPVCSKCERATRRRTGPEPTAGRSSSQSEVYTHLRATVTRL